VKQCTIYQHANHSLHHHMGLLQPLPIPQGVCQDLTMDFIEGLPKSEGCTIILVVVDRLCSFLTSQAPVHCRYNCSAVYGPCGQITWITSFNHI
jgi:hypothetical protein